jgi:hypothetical protein
VPIIVCVERLVFQFLGVRTVESKSISELQLFFQSIFDPFNTRTCLVSPINQCLEALRQLTVLRAANIYGASLASQSWKRIILETHFINTREEWQVFDSIATQGQPLRPPSSNIGFYLFESNIRLSRFGTSLQDVRLITALTNSRTREEIQNLRVIHSNAQRRYTILITPKASSAKKTNPKPYKIVKSILKEPNWQYQGRRFQ